MRYQKIAVWLGGALLLFFIFSFSLLVSQDKLWFLEGLNDEIYRLFCKANLSLNNSIVLVGIDDYSLSHIAYRWPWPRSVYAKLLDKLSQGGAKVVAFDLVFTGQGSSPPDDLKFALSLKHSVSPVLLAYFISHSQKRILPLQMFREYADYSPINTPLDRDGKVRRVRLLQRERDFSDYSFGFKAYLLFSHSQPKIYKNRLLIGERMITLGPKGEVLLNFLLKPSDVKTVSFYAVLKGEIKPQVFKNKAVFVAPLAKIIHDKVNTPLGKMPGVFVHINTFYQFLTGRFVRISHILEVSLFVLVLFIISASVYYFGFLFSFLIFLSSIVLLFWLDVFLGFAGLRFSWGAITVFSFGYWIVINVFKYIYILSALVKIKNKAVKDPLTGLNSLRYFYYLASFRLKHIHLRRRYYLVGLYLKNLNRKRKEFSFSKLKEMWGEISSYLNTEGIWARWEEEIIIGLVGTRKNDLEERLKQIKAYLEEAGRDLGLARLEIKAAFTGLRHYSDLAALSKKMAEELRNRDDNIFYLREEKNRSASLHYQDSLEIIDKDIENKNIHLLSALENLEKEKQKAEEAYLEVIASLVNALEEKDPYTQGHTKRVCDYAVMLAEYLNLPAAEVDNIRKAALLHDIGKIGIPDSILNKKGSLSEEEFAIIKQHTVMGVKILEPIKHLKPVINYILYHHERFDGRGYPHGLSGNMIPQGAQIIAIADSFDAITSGRSYKGGVSFKEAGEKLKEARGKQFSPFLVDKFIEALQKKGFLD